MWKNLLKYTIGLPFMIAISISLILFGTVILICELLAESLAFIIEGEGDFRIFCGTGMLYSAFKIWSPIK